MRVWPGLRLVGAGGKVAKGCFVAVTEAGPDAVRLDTGERFTHAELLRHTRLCHAITYASCQPHAAGPGAPVRHLQPALRAAPPVRRRLEGHQRRAAVRALGAFKRQQPLGGPRGTGRGCALQGQRHSTLPALRFGAMTLQSAAGRIALEWLFSETFPLHTQFVEQPQPLRKWELGKWHDCAAYSWWAKDVRRCLLAGIVPPEQRMFVRLQLQRAGRLCELQRSVDMRDVLRLSAELEQPIRPHSWFLGPIHWAGESQEYVDRVFNVAAIVAQGREPPAELARACEYAECLVDQHMNSESEEEESEAEV